MNRIRLLILAGMLVAIAGCVSMTGEDTSYMTSFIPSIFKDGKKQFMYVAGNRLPSYYQDADITKTHEAWIARELGSRQYCTSGYDIINTTASGDHIVYEGLCK